MCVWVGLGHICRRAGCARAAACSGARTRRWCTTRTTQTCVRRPPAPCPCAIPAMIQIEHRHASPLMGDRGVFSPGVCPVFTRTNSNFKLGAVCAALNATRGPPKACRDTDPSLGECGPAAAVTVPSRYRGSFSSLSLSHRLIWRWHWRWHWLCSLHAVR